MSFWRWARRPRWSMPDREVAEFAGLAQALTVNIGTADPDWVEAMALAAQVMTQAGRPWVLDPVGVGATRFRQDACARLVDLGPSIIRGNASEILALAGTAAAGRGQMPPTVSPPHKRAALAAGTAQRGGGCRLWPRGFRDRWTAKASMSPTDTR